MPNTDLWLCGYRVCVSWLTDPDEEWSTDDVGTSRHGAPESERGYQDSPAYAEEPPRQQLPSYSAVPEGLRAEAPAAYDEPGRGYHDFADDPDDEPRSKLGLIAAIVAAWLVVSIAVLGFLLVTRGPHGGSNTASSSGPTSSTKPSGSPSSQVAAPLPDGWVQQAADTQTDCAAHSYGEIKTFFAKVPCNSVRRVLATTNQGGRSVIVASYVITFNTAEQAKRFNSMVSSDGTGNISDLLREGVTVKGGPSRLPNAAFASQQSGATVRVAEAGYATGASDAGDARLKSVADQAVAR
ncbi:MAG: hypothetical protein QOK10_3507 [Pseudonocardiales bacterium]|nr:hypothetical protein [Pseudonocardiales bacterium]